MISIRISLKFVPKGPINIIPALVWIMAWRRPGDKPLSEPMMVRLPTHICVTRPQWVKVLSVFSRDLFQIFTIVNDDDGTFYSFSAQLATMAIISVLALNGHISVTKKRVALFWQRCRWELENLNIHWYHLVGGAKINDNCSVLYAFKLKFCHTVITFAFTKITFWILFCLFRGNWG